MESSIISLSLHQNLFQKSLPFWIFSVTDMYRATSSPQLLLFHPFYTSQRDPVRKGKYLYPFILSSHRYDIQSNIPSWLWESCYKMCSTANGMASTSRFHFQFLHSHIKQWWHKKIFNFLHIFIANRKSWRILGLIALFRILKFV